MIDDFMYARDYAEDKQAWVVVVVPPEALKDAQNALVAVANGHQFSGRTLRLPRGGCVSLVPVTNQSFLPDDQPFHVMFAGWGGKTTQAQEMARWRTAASRTVSRAA
jgi:hypothetical protein